MGLVIAGGDVWKHRRTIVSPTFTAKKLKTVSYNLTYCKE